MGKPNNGEVENTAAIETMIDYKRGLKNLDTGSKLLSSQTGLDAGLSAMILKSMKRDNVIQSQGPIKKLDAKKPKYITTDKKVHDPKSIEIITAYKKGALNLDEASCQLSSTTGLTADAAISLLCRMKRQNTIRFRRKE